MSERVEWPTWKDLMEIYDILNEEVDRRSNTPAYQRYPTDFWGRDRVKTVMRLRDIVYALANPSVRSHGLQESVKES